MLHLLADHTSILQICNSSHPDRPKEAGGSALYAVASMYRRLHPNAVLRRQFVYANQLNLPAVSTPYRALVGPFLRHHAIIAKDLTLSRNTVSLSSVRGAVVVAFSQASEWQSLDDSVYSRSEAIDITLAIEKCDSWKQLSAIHKEHGAKLWHINIAAMFTRLAGSVSDNTKDGLTVYAPFIEFVQQLGYTAARAMDNGMQAREVCIVARYLSQ